MTVSAKEIAAIVEREDLVRRVADIDVEEITLTGKGLLGDLADAELLLKSDRGREIQDLYKCNETDYMRKFDMWPDEDEFNASCDVFDVEKAQYEGRDVVLNKPYRVSGKSHKFEVFVSSGDGVKKVTFGDPDMEIRRDSDEARASFRARHNCDTATDKTTARYWSCRMWDKGESVSDVLDKDDVMDFDKAMEFIRQQELDDLQKSQVVDFALEIAPGGDEQSDGLSDLVEMVKSLTDIVKSQGDRLDVIAKQREPTEEDMLNAAGRLLKQKKQVSIVESLAKLSESVNGVVERQKEIDEKFRRACGEGA